MKLVKKTEQYSIFQRGDQRYAVKDAHKKPVNGEEKARILLAEDLVKAPLVAKPPAVEPLAAESPAAESPADDAAAGE